MEREKKNFKRHVEPAERRGRRVSEESEKPVQRVRRSERPLASKGYRKEVEERLEREGNEKRVYSQKKQLEHKKAQVIKPNEEVRLNRFISMSGECSRREADALILSGAVKVNGEVVTTLGVKVKGADRVEVNDKPLIPEKKVYILLNKPRDYVTTVEDPNERKTVMELIKGACKERVYPVGRLDRQTSGVLLFTNDGELAKRLTHPSYNHKKIYHVVLDKKLTQSHFNMIKEGVELEDGLMAADELSYASEDKKEVGIEIHSGRNRVVRRLFEHFGYNVVRLDRVYFAGLTKKGLARGEWRFLTAAEVNYLKYFN